MIKGCSQWNLGEEPEQMNVSDYGCCSRNRKTDNITLYITLFRHVIPIYEDILQYIFFLYMGREKHEINRAAFMQHKFAYA